MGEDDPRRRPPDFVEDAMALHYDFTLAGDYLFHDNGLPGDNISNIDRNGAFFASFTHPVDELLVTAGTAGVNVLLDFVDPFDSAAVTVGSTVRADCPDFIGVDHLSAAGLVYLYSVGAINEVGFDLDSDVIAPGLLLSADTGIGATSTLEIDAPALSARSGVGGIDLQSAGSVEIGVLASFGLVAGANGNVKLEAFGTIFFNVVSDPQVVKSGDNSGNVTLKALGAASDIVSLGDGDAVAAPSGKVVMEAGRDILLGTEGNFDNDVRADEGVRLVAGRDVILDGTSNLISDDFFGYTGQGVTVIAGRDIRVGATTGNSAGIRTGGDQAADVRLMTGIGGTLSLLATSGDAILANGNVFIDADRFILTGSADINALGDVVIAPRTDGRAIQIGSATDTATALELSAGEISRIFCSGLTIGSDQAGPLRVTAGIMPPVDILTLVSRSLVRIEATVHVDDLILRSGRDIVITSTASFPSSFPIIGFVDGDGPDGGQGGRALVNAALAESFVFTGAEDGDELEGGAAADTLDGGAGSDTLTGRDGGDTYIVTAADTVTETGATGTDLVISDADWILGAGLENLTLTGTADLAGTGNGLDNRITGNAGANLLTGGDLNDTLIGFAGADTLNGGAGADRLTGGGGPDLLAGGAKNDRLEGGADADRYRFDTPPHSTKNNDDIVDFVTADDTIELENSVFASLGITGTLPKAQFVSGSAAADGNDFIIHNPATGAIYYDSDGSGAGVQVQFASVTPGLVLSRFDVFVT